MTTSAAVATGTAFVLGDRVAHRRHHEEIGTVERLTGRAVRVHWDSGGHSTLRAEDLIPERVSGQAGAQKPLLDGTTDAGGASPATACRGGAA